MEREQPQRQARPNLGSDDVIDLDDAVAIKEAGERLLEETKTLTLSSKALLDRLEPGVTH